ncbi:MAG: SH3 domain-containing protein, partial [Chloroflexota bacterium]
TPLTLPPAGTIGVNGWVKATQNVRLRDQASTSGKIVSVLQTDKPAHVIDGPVDANGYTWWKVDQYDPNNATASGWCAGEFLTATEPPSP